MSRLLLTNCPESSQIYFLAEGLLEFLHSHLGADTSWNETLNFCDFLKKFLLQVKWFLGLLITEFVDYSLNLSDIRFIFESLNNQLLDLDDLPFVSLPDLDLAARLPYDLDLSLQLPTSLLYLRYNLEPDPTDLFVPIRELLIELHSEFLDLLSVRFEVVGEFVQVTPRFLIFLLWLSTHIFLQSRQLADEFVL